MTTIHDYLTSIRESLDKIEAKYAAGDAPAQHIETKLIDLDHDADFLANYAKAVKCEPPKTR
jgi:hypothetical protein